MARPGGPARGEGTVAECPCGLRLWRAVLATCPDADAAACVGCGHVVVVHTFWADEPRDPYVSGYADEELPATVAAWVGAWPRVPPGSPEDVGPYYLPSALRVASAAALADAEDRERAEQHGMTALERLERAGYPPDEPPDGLPDELAHLRYASWVVRTPAWLVGTLLNARSRQIPGTPRGALSRLAWDKARRV